MEVRLSADTPCPSLLIWPVNYSMIGILFTFLATAAIVFVAYLLSFAFAAFVAWLLFFTIIRVCIGHSHLKLALWFIIRDQDSQDTSQYAIKVTYNGQNQHQRSAKTYVVSVNFENNRKYIEFLGVRLIVQNGVVRQVSQKDILQRLGVNNVRNHITSGLSQQQQIQSKSIFGDQRFTRPSLWNIVNRRFCEEKDEIFLLAWILAAQTTITIKEFSPQIFWILGFVIILDISSLIFVIVRENRNLSMFRQQFSGLERQKVTVVRSQRKLQIGLTDILTGDVICFQSGETTVLFSGILSDIQQNALPMIIVRQNNLQKQVNKRILLGLDELNQGQHPEVFKINAFSSFKSQKEQRFIVTDHRSISNAFECWFDRPSHGLFDSLFQKQRSQALSFFIIGILVCVVIFICSHLVYGTVGSNIADSIAKRFLLSICSFPSMIYLLFCLNLHSADRQLINNGAFSYSSHISVLGRYPRLFFNFAELVSPQYRQLLLKKQIFNNSAHRRFAPDTVTFQNSQQFSFLRAVILYVSLGKLDPPGTALRTVQQKFSHFYEYVQVGLQKRIKHRDGPRTWKVRRAFLPEVDRQWRSWLVHFDNSKERYVLTECPYVAGENSFNIYGHLLEDSSNFMAYTNFAQSLVREGKQVTVLLFRKLKDSSQQDEDRLSRDQLQRNLQLVCFVVFDSAISAQKVGIIQKMLTAQNEQQQAINGQFFYAGQSAKIAGFQHVITNTVFYTNLIPVQKVNLAARLVPRQPCCVVSGDVPDYTISFIADFSIKQTNKMAHVFAQQSMEGYLDDSQNEQQDLRGSTSSIARPITFPTNAIVSRLETLPQLYEVGKWSLSQRLSIVKICLWLFFGQIAALSILSGRGSLIVMGNSMLFSILESVFIMLVPLAFVQYFSCSYRVTAPHNFLAFIDIGFIFKSCFVFLIFISVLLIASRDNICQAPISQLNAHIKLSQLNAHIKLRNHVQAQFNNQTIQCIDLSFLIMSTIAVALFSVFGGEANWRDDWKKQPLSILRLLFVPLWIGLLFAAGFAFKTIIVLVGLIIILSILKLFLAFSTPIKEINDTNKRTK